MNAILNLFGKERGIKKELKTTLKYEKIFTSIMTTHNLESEEY